MDRVARCCFHAAVVGLALVSASLARCAEPQTTLSAQQQQVAHAPANGRRLFYIGLGLYSEPWSENDVVELAGRLHQAVPGRADVREQRHISWEPVSDCQ